MCTGSIPSPSAGSPLALPLNQLLVQSTPRHPPQNQAGADATANPPAPSHDPNRGRHVNIAT